MGLGGYFVFWGGEIFDFQYLKVWCCSYTSKLTLQQVAEIQSMALATPLIIILFQNKGKKRIEVMGVDWQYLPSMIA